MSSNINVDLYLAQRQVKQIEVSLQRKNENSNLPVMLGRTE